MLIIIFKLIISFFILLISSKSFLLLFNFKKERYIIFFSVGLIIVTQILFYLSLLNIKYNYYLVNGILLICSFLIILFKRVKIKEFFYVKIKFKGFKKSILVYLLVFLILFQIFFVFSEALIRPIYSYDSLANWAWKVKVFSHENIIPLDNTNDFYLGEDHINYPLFIPLIGTWFSLASFSLVSIVPILSSIIFALSLSYLFYELRRRVDIIKALALTLVLAISPLFIYHGFNFYGDLFFSFYILLAVSSLYNYFRTKNIAYFNLACIFLGALVIIKNAGLFFSLIIIACSFLYFLLNKIRFRKEHVKGIGVYLLLVVPWIFFKSINKLGYSNSTETSFLDFSNFHFNAVFLFFRNLLNYFDFLFLPIIIIVLIVFLIISNVKNIKKIEVFPAICAFLLLGAYIFIYTFTDSYNYLEDGTLDGRNLLTIWPLMIYSVSFLVKGE